LLKIDPRDYQTAMVVAEATLKLRQSELELEKAQHEQAKENWALLGDGTDPSPLTLREPQLAEAMAAVESARARLEEAKRNLERTVIVAPYTGRVQRKMVDVGQVVTPGNDLALIFAIDFVEVRLPIRNDRLDFIELPEQYRGDRADQEQSQPPVVLRGTYGSREVNWEGAIVRAEGAYDEKTRELFVVAQVDDPYAHRGDNRPPLKVGQFVEATIYGTVLSNVFVVPRSALRDNREVLVVGDDNTIQRRDIRWLWKDEEQVIIGEGLEEGEVLCTTPLVFAADGAAVLPVIDGQEPPRQGAPGGPGADGTLMGSEDVSGRERGGQAPGAKRKPGDRS
jgi:RND family efflux transporter MFP subunit